MTDNVFALSGTSEGYENTALVAPLYRIVGDSWNFFYPYRETDGSKTPLESVAPGAVLIVAPGIAPVPLTVSQIVDNGVTFTLADSSKLPYANPNFPTSLRLQIFVTDSLGRRTTYSLSNVVPFRVDTGDLSVLPVTSTVPGSAGPVGPKGDPGIASSQQAIDDAIQAAIQSQIPTLRGNPGESAYQVAVDLGYSGTESQWVASLRGASGAASTVPGPQGPSGESAYQLAVDSGFVGTQSQWLASLQATAGISQQAATNMIAAALIPYATIQQLTEAIASIPPSPTAQYIAQSIATALAPYATASQVAQSIASALAPYSTTAEVTQAITTALSSYVTNTALTSALSSALAGYTTPTQVGTLITNFFSAQTFAPTGATLNNLIDTRAGVIVAQAIANLPNSTAPDHTMSTDLSNPDRGTSPLL